MDFVLDFRLENQSVLAKYQAIWDRYKKQYESKANAKELEKIKNDAMQDEQECKYAPEREGEQGKSAASARESPF